MKKTRFRAAAVACAAAMSIAGCAVQRPPQSVEAPAPAQWYAPLPHNGTLANLRTWWQQLGDPLLVELIEASQTASPTIATARSRIEQARAARSSAGAALLPSLDGQASVSRSNTQPPAPTATIAQLGVQAAWEVDLFGGNRLASRAADARLAAAQAGWHDARVSVAAETATSYLNLRSCERQLAVAINDAKSRAETSRLTQLSADAGFAAPASAALARASSAEAAARATQQRGLCEVEVKTLVALSAMPEPQLRQKLTAAWVDPGSMVGLPVASVPAQLVAQRPDIYQAAQEIDAASADVGTARAQRLPRLTLNGSIALGRARIEGASTNLQTWSIGPVGVTLPIFDGGRGAANVDASQARYDEAVALYTARVRQAVREVEVALVNLDTARLVNEDARVAAEGYRSSFVATEARYRSGLANLVELEDARRTLLAAETYLVGLQRDRGAAWIALYRALGGGWTSTLANDSIATSAPATSAGASARP